MGGNGCCMGDVGERRGADNVGENEGACGGKLVEVGCGECVFVGKMMEDKRMLNISFGWRSGR